MDCRDEEVLRWKGMYEVSRELRTRYWLRSLVAEAKTARLERALKHAIFQIEHMLRTWGEPDDASTILAKVCLDALKNELEAQPDDDPGFRKRCATEPGPEHRLWRRPGSQVIYTQADVEHLVRFESASWEEFEEVAPKKEERDAT
jgi:hypothetical protein